MTERVDEISGTAMFPQGVHPVLDGSCWHYWLSPPPGPQPKGKSKYAYATWIGRPEVASSGVYLWLWPIDDGSRYRLYYVGKSAGQTTSMKVRTKEHIRNAYKLNPVRTIPSIGYGPLGPKLALSLTTKVIVDDQLARTRILYLRPVSVSGVRELVHEIEGKIDRVTREVLGRDNTTNDGATARHELNDEAVRRVVAWLNQIVPMLPSEKVGAGPPAP